jgi:hypothetical protein
MKTLILQNVSTKEIRTVVQAVALADKNEYCIIRSDIDDLEKYSEELRSAIPVGSVEFVRKAMEIAGFKEPMIDPYPITDEKYLHRKVQKIDLIGHCFFPFFDGFVKPTKLKQFTGFVYDPKDYSDEYLNEQKESLYEAYRDSCKIHKSYEVWTSDVVKFMGEWRYYIQNEKIIGYARYDDDDENPEELQEPDKSLIKEYISKLEIKHPYVLDFGILSTGETALVEYNPPFAIGLYGDALSPKQYLSFLEEGWEWILLQSS